MSAADVAACGCELLRAYCCDVWRPACAVVDVWHVETSELVYRRCRDGHGCLYRRVHRLGTTARAADGCAACAHGHGHAYAAAGIDYDAGERL